MEEFFSNFPEFKYNPRKQAEAEFERLRTIRKWPTTGPAYKRNHKKFLKALVSETDSPVHTFFVLQYPDLDYDSRGSPKAEFERLRVLRKWSTTSPKYIRAKADFEEAYKTEFNSDLDGFFAKFQKFDYNPRNEPKSEFERLKVHKGWVGNFKKNKNLNTEYREVREEFFGAFVDVFNSFFGVTGDINTWRFLCDVLEISPIPDTIKGCKKKVKRMYVNIYDVLNHVRHKGKIRKFSNELELANYSKQKNLFFPIGEARGTSLEFLLRKIL